jgi:hypothetical protein
MITPWGTWLDPGDVGEDMNKCSEGVQVGSFGTPASVDRALKDSEIVSMRGGCVLSLAVCESWTIDVALDCVIVGVSEEGGVYCR